MTYFFSMLQFVPDPARGEFVNLGAIVGDDETGDWELRLISNLRRAKALDDRELLPAALSFAGELEGMIEEDAEVPPMERLETLRSLAVDMNNIVRVSAPSRIVADTAAEALDVVFQHKVLDPASIEHRFKKKFPALKATRQSYRHHEVPTDAITEAALVASDRFSGKFDFAVHNGSVVQLAHCWSFQIPNQVALAEEIKAWAWVVHEVRERGGLLSAGGTDLEIPASLDVSVVYVPPKPNEPSAFSEASAAFEEIDVTYMPEDDADSVGQRAAELLQVSPAA